MTWLLVSSMAATVSTAPGRKLTSGGASRRMGSMSSAGATTVIVARLTRNAATTGRAVDSVGQRSASRRRRPTAAPMTEVHRQGVDGRVEDQPEPER